ncbi:MAG: penicillin-binding protein 2 [Alphaproteobacteria bacterium]
MRMRIFQNKDKSRYGTFSRRAVIVSGGMTAVFGILAGRLYQLQVMQGDHYMTRAEDNRVNRRLLAPPRGRIFDRFGVELASNRRNYRAFIVPEQVQGSVAGALDTLAKIVPLSERQRTRVLKDVATNKDFVPVTVVENLSWEDYARLSLDLPYLPGIQLDVGAMRDYPFVEELSHVLGYVAAVSPEDKAGDDKDPLLQVPGFRIGKRGVEKQFDRAIRGRAGSSRAEVNAYGRVIRELSRDPGTPGEDVYLTIDREIQRYAHGLLANESAACIVMDLMTGDVLALVSTPGFDANAFNVGITPDQWNSLTTNDHKPLINKALQGAYPPGSTFKVAVAAAAVEAGVAVPGYSVVCTGGVNLGGHRFHCWKKRGHGRMDLHEGIKRSCDVFFYETARRVGVDKIAEAARALGLGQATGIEIPGERSGLIPTQEWKKATYGVAWQPGETLVTAIGQGYVLTTPLQLCTMGARIASGKMVSPRIVHSVGGVAQRRDEPKPMPISEETLAKVRDGMSGAANEPGGTAFAWRIAQEGFEMAGKTGTAQVRVITRAEHLAGVRKNESLPWHLRDHAWFVAYAPRLEPRYACAVLIEHGRVGQHPDVQVVRDVLLFAQQRDPLALPPSYPVKAARAAQTL